MRQRVTAAASSRIESELASREQSSATQESFLRRFVCNQLFVVNNHHSFQPGPLVYISLDDPDGEAPFTHVFGVELNNNGFGTNTLIVRARILSGSTTLIYTTTVLASLDKTSEKNMLEFGFVGQIRQFSFISACLMSAENDDFYHAIVRVNDMKNEFAYHRILITNASDPTISRLIWFGKLKCAKSRMLFFSPIVFLEKYFVYARTTDKKLALLQFYKCEHEDKNVEWNFKSAATDWRKYTTEGEAAQLGCLPNYMNASAICASHKLYAFYIFVNCALRTQF